MIINRKSENIDIKLVVVAMYGPLAIFDKRIQGFPKSIANRHFVAYLNPENLLLTFNCVYCLPDYQKSIANVKLCVYGDPII